MIRNKIIILSLIITSNIFAKCPDLTQSVSCKETNYKVHLTFDDGPSDFNTAKVLNILKANKVPATFFIKLDRVINRHNQKINISKRKDELQSRGISNYYYFLLGRMKNEGHVIGSHTYHHIHHYSQATRDIDFLKTRKEREDNWIRNIDKSSNKALHKYFFGNSNHAYLRLPYGQGWYEQKSINHDKKKTANFIMDRVEKNGFTHMGWNIDSNDWRYKENEGEQFIIDNLEQICDTKGGIMLMHDTKNIVAKNLQCLIENMKRMSFDLTTVDKIENTKTSSGLNVIGRFDSSKKVQSCNQKKLSLDTKSAQKFVSDFIGDFIKTINQR